MISGTSELSLENPKVFACFTEEYYNKRGGP